LLAPEEEAISLSIEERYLDHEHMNNYTKLLANLANIDMVIEKEDKALILLSYLPDEDYRTFILTLIKSKQSLSYNEVSSTLVNHEL